MRGPGTIARFTADGRKFTLDQRTVTRNRAGARKSVATLYERVPSGRANRTTVKSSLRNLDVAIEDAIEAIRFLTGSDEIDVERL